MIVVINRATGEIVRRLSDRESVIEIEDEEKGASSEPVGNGEYISDKEGKAGYYRADGSAMAKVRYDRFVKVNQARIMKILSYGLSQSDLRLYGVILSVLPFNGEITLRRIKKAIQANLEATGKALSDRSIKRSLKKLCEAGIIKQNKGGYILHPRLAVRGNYVDFDMVETFYKEEEKG